MKIQRLLAKVRERMCYLFIQRGNSITANKVIVAAGYEGLEFKRKRTLH